MHLELFTCGHRCPACACECIRPSVCHGLPDIHDLGYNLQCFFFCFSSDFFFIFFSFFFFLQVGLWIFGGVLNVDAVTAAILGLSVLLITGVVTWKECLSEAVAWDTLTWFAALIAMASYLNKYGLISWFSQTVVQVCFLFTSSKSKIFSCRNVRTSRGRNSPPE